MNNNGYEIIEYESKYKKAYIDLNMKWLQEYDLLEEKDEIMISNVEEEVFDKGGKIFLLKSESDIIGTVGILPKADKTIEIIKLAVGKEYKYLGYGKLLMIKAIKESYDLGFDEIVLYTNSTLLDALKLYDKLGFVKDTLDDSGYEVVDIKMIYKGELYKKFPIGCNQSDF